MSTSTPPSQRTFTRTAPYAPTLYQCYDAARLLAESMVGFAPTVSAVIGIANGGIKPATVVADYLGIPLLTAIARHNTSDEPWQQATGQVTVSLPAGLPATLEGTVLLVDDIAGSGATFDAVTTALTPRLQPGSSVLRLALCRNAGCSNGPDRWVWNVDDWVVFPWEDPHDGDTRLMPAPRGVLTP
ncbi:phosphoribosyltransferase [Kitasatospora sp. NPDC096147]|uniref:phosphoribosyltransferase n=1 Tax=Kitasatospora sp. NPDC096147 TaxID=3364093 RepID=UPI0038138CDC